MPSEIKSKTETEVTLAIKVTPEVLEHAREHAFNHLRGHVKASGFRPGKAPDHIVERELGSDTVQSEALEHATRDSYSEAVQEHDIAPIGPPQISLSKFVPYTEMEYTAKVEIMPQVQLPDWKKLKFKRPPIKIEDSEIERTIDDLRKRLAERQDVKRPAKLEDAVTINFDGSLDGKPIEGASAKSYELVLGSKSFIPGFEEELIGLKEGDKKEFDITFPADYHQQSLAGQKVKFAIELLKVKEVTLPPVDDAFAAKVGPFKSVAELKADITSRLSEEKAAGASREFEQTVLDGIVEQAKVATPQRLVDEQVQYLQEEMEQNLMYAGLDISKFLDLQEKTREQWQTELRPQAEKRVKLGLVLRAIADSENILIKDAEVEAELARLRATHSDEQAQAELAKDQTKRDIANQLLLSKTISKIIEYTEDKKD